MSCSWEGRLRQRDSQGNVAGQPQMEEIRELVKAVAKKPKLPAKRKKKSDDDDVPKSKCRLFLKKNYLDEIQAGSKKWEGRTLTGSVVKAEVGDHVRFSLSPTYKEWMVVKVIEKRVYSGYKDMLEDVPIQELFPGVQDIESATEIFKSLPHYAKDPTGEAVAWKIEYICSNRVKKIQKSKAKSNLSKPDADIDANASTSNDKILEADMSRSSEACIDEDASLDSLVPKDDQIESPTSMVESGVVNSSCLLANDTNDSKEIDIEQSHEQNSALAESEDANESESSNLLAQIGKIDNAKFPMNMSPKEELSSDVSSEVANSTSLPSIDNVSQEVVIEQLNCQNSAVSESEVACDSGSLNLLNEIHKTEDAESSKNMSPSKETSTDVSPEVELENSTSLPSIDDKDSPEKVLDQSHGQISTDVESAIVCESESLNIPIDIGNNDDRESSKNISSKAEISTDVTH